jgi:hypothetical protein
MRDSDSGFRGLFPFFVQPAIPASPEPGQRDWPVTSLLQASGGGPSAQ